MTIKQKNEIQTVLLIMQQEQLQGTESYRRLWKIYEKWINPKPKPGVNPGRTEIALNRA